MKEILTPKEKAKVDEVNKKVHEEFIRCCQQIEMLTKETTARIREMRSPLEDIDPAKLNQIFPPF